MSHPVSHTSSPAISRTHLGPPMVGSTSRLDQPVKMPNDNKNAPSPAASTVRSVQDREVHMSPMTESTSRQVPSDSYAGPPPTPGMDDVPYIRFAINQLTREEDSRSLRRPSSVASEDYPAERLIWDEGLGISSAPLKRITHLPHSSLCCSTPHQSQSIGPFRDQWNRKPLSQSSLQKIVCSIHVWTTCRACYGHGLLLRSSSALCS